MWIDAGSFLITVLFDFYLTVLLLRFMLQWVGASYYNPISQFAVKLTEPVLKPLRKILPAKKGIDFATLLTLLIVAMVKHGLLILLENQTVPYILGIVLLAIANLLSLICSILFFMILIRVILSWIGPRSYNPAIDIIQRVTDPLLARVQRIIPPIGGIDLSPLVIIVFLQLINYVFIERFIILSKGLAILG